MNESGFDTWTRRRFGAAAGLAAFLAAAGGDAGEARKNRRKKKPKRKHKEQCQGCLTAPFTVTATWQAIKDYHTFLFVPRHEEAIGAYIRDSCPEGETSCEDTYPFACVIEELTANRQVTTIHRRLSGDYEYWFSLPGLTAPNEVTIVLRDSEGRIVRQWENLTNALANPIAWHVFDIDGSTGRVTSIDDLIIGALPAAAHDPNTNVCPTGAK